jgi:hypothetical protein
MRKLCGGARAAPEAANSLLILVCLPRPLSFKTRFENEKGTNLVIRPVPETAANPKTMF